MSINFIVAFGTFYIMAMVFFAYCKYDDRKHAEQPMTFDEIKQIPELQIEVTPEVEDAFYFLHGVIEKAGNVSEAQSRCGEHLKYYPLDVQKKAIEKAMKMIDNIEKYGVACAAWV